MAENGITPFDNCPALDGYHCETNSLAKIYHFNNARLSEEMLFGLGAGIGFTYRHPKSGSPYIDGRGNTKSFFEDVGKRTGVSISAMSTSSPKKAESALIARLNTRMPVMLFGDTRYLPWFKTPEEPHFESHSFIICGYDGNSNALASDIAHNDSGLKKGFYHAITLPELAKARGSAGKPSLPRNVWLDFDFVSYEPPAREVILGSVRKNAEAMLYPSISSLGVRGIRRTSRELLSWPDIFGEAELSMHLFGLYVAIETSGTGGGFFRQMYSRFLLEAADAASNRTLRKTAGAFAESGNLFTEAALLFESAHEKPPCKESIARASESFSKIADIEEKAFDSLYEKIPQEA